LDGIIATLASSKPIIEVYPTMSVNMMAANWLVEVIPVEITPIYVMNVYRAN
jgi:hypothetical protein